MKFINRSKFYTLEGSKCSGQDLFCIDLFICVQSFAFFSFFLGSLTVTSCLSSSVVFRSHLQVFPATEWKPSCLPAEYEQRQINFSWSGVRRDGCVRSSRCCSFYVSVAKACLSQETLATLSCYRWHFLSYLVGKRRHLQMLWIVL